VYKGKLRRVDEEIEVLDLGKWRLDIEYKHQFLESMDPIKVNIVIRTDRGFKSYETKG
jgi:hypothetical protein